MNIQQIRNFADTHTGGILLGQDGSLTRATAGEHLRSFFNIGDARTRNRDLLDTIRAAIRTNSDYFSSQAAAISLVDGIGTTCVVTGKDLQRLFTALDRLTKGKKLDDLTKMHVAMRGAPEAFETRGKSEAFTGVAKLYVELEFQKAAANREVATFNVSEVLDRFYQRTDELLKAATGKSDDPNQDKYDLTDTFCEGFHQFLVSGDARIRDQNKVMKAIDECQSFVSSTRTESVQMNNPDYARLAEAFLRMRRNASDLNALEFKAFADKSLLAGDELKDQIRDALAANDLDGLHRAILCVATRLQSVIQGTTGAMFHESGEDSVIMQRAFARFVVTKLPPETRTNLHVLMTGEEAKNLVRFYAECSRNRGSEQAATVCLCNVFLGLSDEAANLGVLSSEGKEWGLGSFGDNNLSVDTSKLPCSIIFRHRGEAIITASQGYVPAMGRGILDPDKSINLDNLPTLTKQHGTAFLKGFLAQRLAEGAEAVEDRFKVDLKRGLQVKLPGGISLSTEEGAAFNQLAVAVTGRQDAVFATLSEEQKTRVHMAMALLSQNMQTLTEQISLTMLDGPAREMPIHPGPSDTVNCTFSLERDADGGLSVRMRAKREITSYGVDPNYSWSLQRETFDVRDSFTDSSLDVTISGQELDRISKLDWAQCNTTKLKEFLQSEKPEKKWMLDIPNKLPESYRIDFEARPACRLHIGWQAYQEDATYPKNYVRS